MPHRRVVTAVRAAAFLTRAQMDPRRADLYALLALTAFGVFDRLHGLARAVTELAKTLTRREHEVMAAVVQGLMNKQIAFNLGISEITVKLHRGNVMRKMDARSVADLVRKAELLGL